MVSTMRLFICPKTRRKACFILAYAAFYTMISLCIAATISGCGGNNKGNNPQSGKGEKPDKKEVVVMPKTPIEADKLVRVLSDIHEAEVTLGALPLDKRDSAATLYYSSIFKINGVSKADFDKSFDAYMQAPAAAQALYERVVNRLTQDESENH